MQSNRSSWDEMLAFVEDLPDEHWRTWKETLRPILRESVRTGLNDYFRAGSSVNHLIFSTAEKHGLEDIEPRPPHVTLAVDENHRLFVTISRYSIHFNAPDKRDFLGGANAFDVFKSYLRNLWVTTRPNEALPRAVA